MYVLFIRIIIHLQLPELSYPICVCMTFTNTCNDTCEKCCIRKNHDDGGDIDEVDDIAHHIHATIETDISIDAADDDSYLGNDTSYNFADK